MIVRSSTAVSMARLYLLVVALAATSRCETRKTFHSKIAGASHSISSSRRLFHSAAVSYRPHETVSGVDNLVEPEELPPVTREEYVKSIPLRVLNCLQHVPLVDCGKLYLLQNMEAKAYRFESSGNLTYDVQQVLLPGYRQPDQKLFSDDLLNLNGTEVNRRIERGLRLLFNERIVDLQLVPGLAVRLTPSDTNELQFSVKKDVSVTDPTEFRGKAKKGIKHLLNLSVPIILLPSMLLAGVLPMVMPILKFATIFSSIVNHAALAAAIMYLAKQHAQEQEAKQTVYFNAGYN